jgi:hypothetical protein
LKQNKTKQPPRAQLTHFSEGLHSAELRRFVLLLGQIDVMKRVLPWPFVQTARRSVHVCFFVCLFVLVLQRHDILKSTRLLKNLSALHWLTAGLLERHDDFAAARRSARRKELAPEKRGEKNTNLKSL